MTSRLASAPVVLFDFGGTLDADGRRWSARFHHAYHDDGGQLGFSEFEPLFRESDAMLLALPGIQHLGYYDTVLTQARLLGRLLPDARYVSLAAIADRFYRESVATIERNRPLLERLATRYRLGMISNFSGNLASCLADLRLTRFFAVVLDSGVEGREKPDPHLFRRGLAALDAEPADAWMVGDNFEADIRPALALGMRACWVGGRDDEPDRVGEVFRIASLLDLEPVLERNPCRR